MKIFLLIFTIIFIFEGAYADSTLSKPEIKNGKINLTNWKRKQDRTIKLDGNWTFFWKRVIPPKFEEVRDAKKGIKFPVPEIWSSFEKTSGAPDIKAKGHATYVLKIEGLNPKAPPIGLEFSGITSNFQAFYVEKSKTVPLGGNGVFATNKKNSIPQFKKVITKLSPSETSGYLVLHVSSFHYASGGLFYSLRIGNYEHLAQTLDLEKLRNFFVLGLLLIMGMYHFGLFYRRKKDYGGLFFGLFCFAIFFRLFGLNSYFNLYFNSPSILLFEITRKIELVPIFMAPAFFYGFSRSIIPDFFGEKMLKIGMAVGSVYAFIGLFTPARIFSSPLFITSYEIVTAFYVFYILYFAIRAAIENKIYSKVFLLGLGIMAFGFFYDVLIHQRVFPPPFITPYTLTIFIFIQSHILAIKFSDAYNTAEVLMKNLSNEVEKQVIKIKKQNMEMGNLLENLEEGFMVIDSKGIVQEGASKITNTFFKVKTEKQPFSKLLELNEEEQTIFEKWCYHIWKGKILFKDLVALAPSFYDKKHGQYIKLDYRPIYSKKYEVDKIICIASDVTKERNLELKALEEKDQTKMILLILERPLHFLDLIEDSREFLDIILYQRKLPNSETLFRQIHTLKARFSNFKIRIISQKMHALEDDLLKNQEIEKEFIYKKLEELEGQLNQFLKENQQVIRSANLTVKSTDSSRQMRSSEVKKYVFDQLNDFLEGFNNKFILRNFSSGLRDFFQSTKELAEQQDKKVNIIMEEKALMVDLAQYDHFFSCCIHLFRNAIDHGIEDPETRKQKNKSDIGLIKINFDRDKNNFIKMTFEDDGVGVHLGLLKRSVLKMGLKSEKELKLLSEKEITQFIFVQGISTKEETTGISGRGIGLDALYNEVRELGGNIWAKTKTDGGTIFFIVLPFFK